MSLVPQLYPTLCDPMDYSPPGSSVQGILHARILVGCHWRSSQPRDQLWSLALQAYSLPCEHQGSPLPTFHIQMHQEVSPSCPFTTAFVQDFEFSDLKYSWMVFPPGSQNLVHLPAACWFAASNLYYSNPFQPPHPEWQRECARASPSFMIILLFPHCLAPSAPSLLFCQACRFSNLSSHITSLSKSFLPPLSRTRGHSSVILSHLEHAPAVCGHIQLTTWTCDVWPLHLLHWDMWGKKLLILL